MTNDDLFRESYNSLESHLNRIDPIPMKEIAVKNGKTMHGATAVYGDGNQKINRKKCNFPKRLLVSQTNSKSTLEDLDCNLHVCPNEPQGGNRHAQGFLSCVSHTRILVDSGLEANKINEYITYMSVLEQLAKLNSKANTDKRKVKREKLQNVLNGIDDNDKKTYDSFTETYETSCIRRSKRITNETKSKLHATMQKENES